MSSIQTHWISSPTQTDTLVVSFGGISKRFYGIPPYEFLGFLGKHYPHYDCFFIVDAHQSWYHKGIDETIQYLDSKIKPYKRVIFLGCSAGGYAALLFGSILNVDAVFAIIPQTLLKGQHFEHMALTEKYIDVMPFINPHTKYLILGDSSLVSSDDLHSIEYCNRLAIFPNVNVIRKHNINIKELRDTGELLEILQQVIPI